MVCSSSLLNPHLLLSFFFSFFLIFSLLCPSPALANNSKPVKPYLSIFPNQILPALSVIESSLFYKDLIQIDKFLLHFSSITPLNLTECSILWPSPICGSFSFSSSLGCASQAGWRTSSQDWGCLAHFKNGSNTGWALGCRLTWSTQPICTPISKVVRIMCSGIFYLVMEAWQCMITNGMASQAMYSGAHPLLGHDKALGLIPMIVMGIEGV